MRKYYRHQVNRFTYGVVRDLKQTLEVAKPIALKAGEILMKYQNEGFTIDTKRNEIDIVTEADISSEKYVVSALSETFPEDAILAEEGSEKKGGSGYTWVIDPLDGTTSFSHKFPFFAVAIALVDADNKPIVGLVYAPKLNEFFCAAEGHGSYLNDVKLQVSQTKEMHKSLIGIGFPYNRREIMPRLMTRLSNVLHKAHDVRRSGSAALDICYVACGRYEAYFEEGLKAWDTAASVIILREAGGLVTNYSKGQFDIFVPEIVGSNQLVHDQIVQVIDAT